GATEEARVEGNEAAAEQAREGEVLGVIGLRPAELVREPPSLTPQSIRTTGRDRQGLESRVRFPGNRCRNLASPGRLVQRRPRLGPHDRRCDELYGAEAGEPVVARRCADDDTRIQ